MSKDFQSKLSDLDKIIAIQRDQNLDDYMYGLLNGMILSRAIFDGNDPVFQRPIDAPPVTKVRHRLKK
jgi:hypothetical protein